MLNEPQGNCFLNEPLIDYFIPKYLIFIISISQIFSTYPELDSPGKVATLAHGHVVRLPLPDDVTRLVSLPECAELKNYRISFERLWSYSHGSFWISLKRCYLWNG